MPKKPEPRPTAPINRPAATEAAQQLNRELAKANLDPAKISSQLQPRTEPLWKGPCDPSPMGGVTFSLINRWLVDRERARLYLIEGIKSADTFNHKAEYGNMWHVCEEAAAQEKSFFKGELSGIDTANWSECLIGYCQSLLERYPQSADQIEHWYSVCKMQFPLYIKHWRDHPDQSKRIPLSQEYVFHIPYELPSRRVVYLRGKWDSVDLVEREVWLQENKTRGDINPVEIEGQLTNDLQTMLYIIALEQYAERYDEQPIKGIRYNVVRRPLSGGKGTIVRHKPSKKEPMGESAEAFYERLGSIIAEDPGHYFMRWNVEISSRDIERFRVECLDPILEGLATWYDWILYNRRIDNRSLFTSPPGNHFRMPYGVSQYGPDPNYDGYLSRGSMIGLRKIDTLFEEL